VPALRPSKRASNSSSTRLAPNGWSMLCSSVTSAMIRHLMAVRHADVHPETGPQVGRNWALIGLVGLCVEFWIVALAVLTSYL
jgi:hypothetical protein